MKIIDSNSRFSKYLKPQLQRLFYRKKTKCRLLVLGSQRSGTTMLTRLFDDLFTCSVYGEYSILSNQDQFRLRLNPIDDVISQLNRNRAPLVIMKPLVESQNATALLSRIPNSKALWVYRSPIDSVASSIKKFGEGEGAINKVRPLFDSSFSKNLWTGWLTENVTEDTKEICSRFWHQDMNPVDAGLLFWYIRNIFFFQQNLENNPKCIVLDYDDLLLNPKREIGRIKTFINMPTLKINCNKITKQNGNVNLEFNNEIYKLCDDLYLKLRALNK